MDYKSFFNFANANNPTSFNLTIDGKKIAYEVNMEAIKSWLESAPRDANGSLTESMPVTISPIDQGNFEQTENYTKYDLMQENTTKKEEPITKSAPEVTEQMTFAKAMIEQNPYKQWSENTKGLIAKGWTMQEFVNSPSEVRNNAIKCI
jgi:hypothetical protein